MDNNNTCNYKEGSLPRCAPLALAAVPMQKSAEPAYDRREALVRGTLFPGLDLPFMDYVAVDTLQDTPLAELMALDFVTQELALYLDTHSDDGEAFETWKTFTALAEEGRRRYAEMCGPVSREQTAFMPSWTWTGDPWPWEYKRKGGNE